MFGLLGGLLLGGIASRAGGGGGLLGGLMNRNRGSAPQQQPSSPASPKDAPMEKAPEEQSGQTKAPQQPQQPQQQPFDPPQAEKAATEIAQNQTAAKAERANPLSGLTDEAPAAPAPQKDPGEPVAKPQDVVNKTPTLNAVAKPVEEKLGQAPVTLATDTLANQLMDSGSNRQLMDFQDGNPSRQPDLPNQSYTADQGYRFVGPTTVGGAMPARMYRPRY